VTNIGATEVGTEVSR